MLEQEFSFFHQESLPNIHIRDTRIHVIGDRDIHQQFILTFPAAFPFELLEPASRLRCLSWIGRVSI